MGQLVGTAIELAIGQLLRIAHEGDGVRRSLDLRLEELINADIPRRLDRGAVPLHELPPPLGFAQQGQVRNALLGIGDDGVQQGAKMPRHPGDGVGLEQIGVVDEGSAQPLIGVGDLERQIEVSRLAVALDRAQGHARQRDRLERRVVQHEHNLEERVAAQVPLHVQFLDQPIEGQVLMGIGPQADLPDAPQQLAKTRVARKVRAQDQRVDEESDQPFGLEPIAVGDRRAHDQVVVVRVAMQQQLERRQKCHELRCPVLAAQGLEPVMQVFRQDQRLVRAAERLHRRPGMVERQIDDGGGAGQLPLPIGDLAFEDVALQPLPLPLREVRVLNGRGGQGRGAAGAVREIKRRHFSNQYPRRPTVGDDVVHRQQADMLLLVQLQNCGTQERPSGQIEGTLGFRGDQATHLGLALARRQRAQVDDRQRDRQVRGDHLRGPSIHLGKGGA